MAVVFTQGQQLGPNDLTLILFDGNGNAFDPHTLYYEFYGKDPIQGEWRVGASERQPFQTQSGFYYVSERLTTAFLPGSYYIQWVMRRDDTSPLEIVKKQEFAFIGS
jgi:hypothetical protein